MNVFIKITLSSLKKNRTRTIVTIIGVILSVAMITAVTTLIASLQSFMIRNVIATDGDWHIQFMEADSALVQRLSADNEVAAAAVSQNIGYAVLEGGQNENKPYLFVAGFDDKAMEMNVFTKLRYPAKVYKFAQSAGGGSGYTYNNDLLRYMGISKDETFNAVLYRLGGIFILLIMLGSILLIHNSFSISVAERTRQFGILSSVGATPQLISRPEGVLFFVLLKPLNMVLFYKGDAMSQLEKLLKKIRNNPKQVRFVELDKILIRTGFERRQPGGGSSHYIYTKGEDSLVVPFDQPHIKAVYVERAIKLLEGGIIDE